MLGRQADPHPQHRGRVQPVLRRRAADRDHRDRRAGRAARRSSSRHLHRPLVWLPTGLFLGGAAGNLIDRVRLGAVTDFVKLPHWPAFNVADICITFGVLTLVWVLERGEMKVPPEAAGERLDVFLAGVVGSRAKAQRLIDAGLRARRRRARSPSATCSPAARRVERRRAARRRRRRRCRRRAFRDRLRGRAPARDRQAARASSCTRASATREGTLVQALAGRVAGGPDPERPGVVHRLDRDTSGLLAARALRARRTRRCRRRCERARSRASTSRWSRAARRARRGTIDAPLGRDRRVRTRMSTDTDDPHEARHALRGRARAARRHAAARDAGDRPDAPDPRAPAGDRASGRRRPGVRARAESYGLSRQFLHAERLAFNHPESGASVDLRAPLPEDLVRALRQASGERTDQSV